LVLPFTGQGFVRTGRGSFAATSLVVFSLANQEQGPNQAQARPVKVGCRLKTSDTAIEHHVEEAGLDGIIPMVAQGIKTRCQGCII
jgi:hypothetical protein